MNHRPSKSFVQLSMLAVATACVFGSLARSAPEPSLLQTSWQFDFEFKTPRLITVKMPEDKAAKSYWYLPYTVTNNTGEDRLFIPEFTVMGNDGTLLTAGRGVSPAVFKEIAKEQRNELLESPLDVMDKLLQGEDNARDSVAIWPVTDADIDTMHVFVKGLAGETALVENPVSGEKVILRKCLHLSFQTPGSQHHRLQKPVRLVNQAWVMR